MSMLFRTLTRTSFSLPVGGGVHTKVAGIVRGTMTGVGVIIQTSRLFIERCPGIGGRITGTISGEASLGNTNALTTKKFKRTGTVGKETSIGKNKGGESKG